MVGADMAPPVRQVVPEWERLTAHIEADPESKERLGWVREMYAFSVATALKRVRLEMLPCPLCTLIAQPPADPARSRQLPLCLVLVDISLPAFFGAGSTPCSAGSLAHAQTAIFQQGNRHRRHYLMRHSFLPEAEPSLRLMRLP